MAGTQATRPWMALQFAQQGLKWTRSGEVEQGFWHYPHTGSREMHLAQKAL